MGGVTLTDELNTLKGVGQARSELFKKLNIYTVGDLLTHYPRDYIDWNAFCRHVSECDISEPIYIKVTVSSGIREHRVRNNMVIYKFTALEEDGIPITVTLFNNRFLAAKIHLEDELILNGKIEQTGSHYTMASPNILPLEQAGIIPTYSQTKGLTNYGITTAIQQVIPHLLEIYASDTLPNYLLEKLDLCDIYFALEQIHNPTTFKMLAKALSRLVFEELLILQLGMGMLKNNRGVEFGVGLKNKYIDEFLKVLPYKLTTAQLNAVNDSINDMLANGNGKVPAMNRLIQGDVGSGKTAVACAVAYSVIKNGYQVALMVPTEILAEQHFKSITKLFKPLSINIEVLTGSTKAAAKRTILERLKSGEIDLLIGTHALIENNVEFANLALVITDEQHRFGVKQRAKLSSKGNNPHMLVMSATPIPRTLALIVYGDLDMSIINELPAGRIPIETYCVDSAVRTRSYKFIKKNVKEGRQCYIICPLVEEGVLDLQNVTNLYEDLSTGFFADCTVGLLHGKLKAKEKEKVMRSYADGTTDILVATTVVEVGVDVPNANIILIENAERFGLSQLHQLRGRVGRGEYKSYCILLSDSKNEETMQRLNIMKNYSSGFDIAEHDLKLRGPGDFFGARQHGLPQLKIADMLKDIETLNRASQVSGEILSQDMTLSKPEHAQLKQAVTTLFKDYGNTI